MGREQAGVTIRAAELGDTETLVNLLQAAFAEYVGRLDPPSGVHGETIESVGQHLERAGALLALLGDEPVGCVFYRFEPDHVYLGRLAVLPEFRRAGVGGALIRQVEAAAAKSGMPCVRLATRIKLPHLIAGYERAGYRIIQHGTHEGYAEPTFVVMEKQLSTRRTGG